VVSQPINTSLAILLAALLWGNTTQSTGLFDPIDFSPLLKKATLLRETTGTRISVINGKVVEIALRWMDLQPKSPGLLVICWRYQL